jgi:ubiquinone/menaquinone biosynthesis C-methylase UbiE
MVRDYIKFNKPLPLREYFRPLIGEKKEVKIADIGSGPYSVIGSYLPDVKVEMTYCDRQDFREFWEKREMTSVISVEQQDMENLTYQDNYFDIVHCLNALDHTRNAEKAVKEMIRICKPGGWVYIHCSLNQLDTGYRHFWNAKSDGTLTNKVVTFDLKDYGFDIKFVDNGGLSRYNTITAIKHKI